MSLYRRLGARAVDRAPSTSTPRVKLAREELWMVPIPADPSERVVLTDRRGRLVLSAYAVYTDVTDPRDFEACVQPVLRTLAASRSRCILTLVDTPESFDAGRTRHAVQAARELGLASMVEIQGTWGLTLLELLAAAGPGYIRLAPDFVHGAGSVPDVFRLMVSLSEFSRERGFELVARNPRDEHELDAVRVAGIGLVQWTSVPFSGEEGTPPPPVLLAR